jgi:ribose transport system permease protein
MPRLDVTPSSTAVEIDRTGSSGPRESRRRRSVTPAERRRRVVTWAQQNGVLFALLVMCAFFASQNDRFLTRGNVNIILLQVAVTGIIAVPAAMLILAGYVDLSVGSMMVLSAIAFGQVVERGGSEPVAVLAALGVGAAWGLTSGFFISYLGFSPIVVTLGGLAAARGVAQVWSDAITVSDFSETFGEFGIGRWFDTPIPIFVAAGVFLVGFYAWNQSTTGRHLAAIGSDEVAARAMGVRTKRLPFIVYGLSGLAAAVGGLIVTAQLDGASMSIGEGEELTVLTAVLLGGVSFKGGRGSLLGVLSGLLFLGALRNGLILLGVGTFWQQVAIGAALFFAAALDVIYQRLERLALEKAVDADDSTGSIGVSDDD